MKRTKRPAAKPVTEKKKKLIRDLVDSQLKKANGGMSKIAAPPQPCHHPW